MLKRASSLALEPLGLNLDANSETTATLAAACDLSRRAPIGLVRSPRKRTRAGPWSRVGAGPLVAPLGIPLRAPRDDPHPGTAVVAADPGGVAAPSPWQIRAISREDRPLLLSQARADLIDRAGVGSRPRTRRNRIR